MSMKGTQNRTPEPDPKAVLNSAVATLQNTIGDTQAILTDLWDDLTRKFIAADIQEPFADYAQRVFSRFDLLTILRAIFASSWTTIIAQGSAEVSRRNTSRKRLGLGENLELFLWYGPSVFSQRCWKIVSQQNLGSCTARDLFLELRRAHNQLSPQAHYLEKGFKPRHFAAAVLAIADKQKQVEASKSDSPIEDESTRHESMRHESPQDESRRDESTRHDNTQDKSTQDKSAQDETTRHETTRHESAQDKSRHDESAEESTEEGSAQEESAQNENFNYNSPRRNMTMTSEDSGFFASDSETPEEGREAMAQYRVKAPTATQSQPSTIALQAAKKTIEIEQDTSGMNALIAQLLGDLVSCQSSLFKAQDEMEAVQAKWQDEQTLCGTKMEKSREAIFCVLDAIAEDPQSTECPQAGSRRTMMDHYDEFRSAVGQKRKATDEIAGIDSKKRAVNRSVRDMFREISHVVRRQQIKLKEELGSVRGPDTKESA